MEMSDIGFIAKVIFILPFFFCWSATINRHVFRLGGVFHSCGFWQWQRVSECVADVEADLGEELGGGDLCTAFGLSPIG